METLFKTKEFEEKIKKSKNVNVNPFNFTYNKSEESIKICEKYDLLDDFFSKRRFGLKFSNDEDVIKKVYNEYVNNFKNLNKSNIIENNDYNVDDEKPEKYISFKNWIIFHPITLDKKNNKKEKDYYSPKIKNKKINIFNCFQITKYTLIKNLFTKKYLKNNKISNVLRNYRNIYIQKDNYNEIFNFFVTIKNILME